jgi:ABC-2 type transport system ATP-binding protein
MLEINKLTFGYKHSERLFNNLNLSLKAGGVCGLLGKNGSGKTTLLKIIAGLIFPTTGTCQILGYAPKERHPDFLKDIYFLPEDLSLPAVTIDTYLKLYAGFYAKFDHRSFNQSLKEFDIAHNKLLTQFSYGQKKKFLIAFGLATNCKLLILDEPTNGLDIPSKVQFRKVLSSYITEEKLIIISTHQVHDIENIIDSIIILNEGKTTISEKIFNIMQKLAFLISTEEPTIDIYHEKRLGGYIAVMPNIHDQETEVDLEVLFNAVLSNPQKIQHHLEEKNDE